MLSVRWHRVGRWSAANPTFKWLPTVGSGSKELTRNILTVNVADKTQKVGLCTAVLRGCRQGLFCPAASQQRCLHKDVELEENFNLASGIIEPLARTKGDKTCLILSDGKGSREEVSYRELFVSSLQLSTGLIAHTNRHQTVSSKIALVIVPKILPWWVINVAASWSGFTVSPCTSMLRGKDIHYRLAQSRADCVFCVPDLVPGIDQAENNLPKQQQLLKVVIGASVNFDVSGWIRYEDLLSEGKSLPPVPCHATLSSDICQLFFTSGTTGNPKMVPHTHASYARGHRTTARTWLDLNEDDVLFNMTDTGWAKAAWTSLYTPFWAGATAFVHQMNKFDPLLLLEALQQEPVSVMCAPPTAYRTLVQLPLQDYSFRRLRHCVSAGEPLNPEVMDKWTKKTGLRIYEGYGQSETTLMCATMPGMEIKPGSMGRPGPGYDLRVLDDDLQELSEGQEGQIAVKTEPVHPDGLFKGYQSDPEKTLSVFRGGYYLTGDRGLKDRDGYLWFVARDDDVITSSGYRIGPFEVESALLEHDSVVESGVVGVPDPLRGHVVKAFVVLAADAAARVANDVDEAKKLKSELQEHVKLATAPYKYPRQIEFVTSLPKTVSGKIRRVELRQQTVMKDGPSYSVEDNPGQQKH